MLAFQHTTNQRLRELEIINDEKSSLLRAALLDRDHLSPELLDLKRVETLRQIRERIDAVLQAPAEAQPQVLDATSTEIAETVLSAEAALEKAKNVSICQISYDKSPSSAFDIAISTMKRRQLGPSFSAATLITPTTPRRDQARTKKSISEKSTSTAGTGQTAWQKMTQLVSPKRRTQSAMCSTEYYSALTSAECAASLSLA